MQYLATVQALAVSAVPSVRFTGPVCDAVLVSYRSLWDHRINPGTLAHLCV